VQTTHYILQCKQHITFCSAKTLHFAVQTTHYILQCKQHITFCSVNNTLHFAVQTTHYILQCKQHNIFCSANNTIHFAVQTTQYILCCCVAVVYFLFTVNNIKILGAAQKYFYVKFISPATMNIIDTSAVKKLH
jgi:YHS domain-containing protein